MASLALSKKDLSSPLSPLELPVREPQSPTNRRTLPRLATRFVVKAHKGGPDYRGVDLSFGGLMCVGDDPLWPGNPIAFDLVLPGEARPIAVSGRVVDLVSYRGEIAMRVRFDVLNLVTRKRIALWMSRGVRS